MFITIEDETGAANLVIWPSLYKKQRRIILTANMIAVEGKVQREGLVVHIVADRLVDLSDELAKIGEQDTAVRLPSGRGDNYRGYNAPDPREPKPAKPRDIYIPDLHIDSLRLKTRNLR